MGSCTVRLGRSISAVADRSHLLQREEAAALGLVALVADSGQRLGPGLRAGRVLFAHVLQRAHPLAHFGVVARLEQELGPAGQFGAQHELLLGVVGGHVGSAAVQVDGRLALEVRLRRRFGCLGVLVERQAGALHAHEHLVPRPAQENTVIQLVLYTFMRRWEDSGGLRLYYNNNIIYI